MTPPAPAPQRAGHVLSVPVGDETVLYDPVGDVLHRLDTVSSAVWRGLDGDASVAEMCHRLAARAAADEERVRTDVRRLLVRLRDAHLLRGDADVPGRAVTGPAEDPPGWAAAGPVPPLPRPFRTATYAALRHGFRVRSNLPEVCGWLDTALVDLAATVESPADYVVLDLGEHEAPDRYVLGFDGRLVARSGWLARILSLLLWRVNTEAAERSAGDHVLLHAAAAARDGRAVILPAAMEQGKTTTVAGLVRAGWQYLTDEMVAIDPRTLNLSAYPRPLSVDRGSWEVLADLRPAGGDRITGQWQVPASSIRPDAVAAGAAPVAVVAPAYRAGSRTGLRRVSPGQLVLDLADSTFGFRADPRRNLETLAALAVRVPAYRLTIGRLDHAVALVGMAADVATALLQAQDALFEVGPGKRTTPPV